MEYRGKSRVGLFHPDLFWEMAKESVEKWEQLEGEIADLKSKGTFVVNGHEEYNEIMRILQAQEELKKETVKSVMFLVCFLEAFFFELAAEAIGQKYAERYIENMNIKTKIVTIPRLVTGKDLGLKNNDLSDVFTLISWRNKIVHPKTKDGFTYTDKMMEIALKEFKGEDLTKDQQSFKKSRNQFPEVTKYYEAVRKLIEELDQIDPEGMHFRYIKAKTDHIQP